MVGRMGSRCKAAAATRLYVDICGAPLTTRPFAIGPTDGGFAPRRPFAVSLSEVEVRFLLRLSDQAIERQVVAGKRRSALDNRRAGADIASAPSSPTASLILPTHLPATRTLRQSVQQSAREAAT